MEKTYLNLELDSTRPKVMPRGLKHYDKNEPILYAEWALSILIGIFAVKRYKGKHERIEPTWTEYLAQKIDAFDTVMDLLAITISALGSHLLKSCQLMMQETKKFVQRSWQVIFGKVSRIPNLVRKGVDHVKTEMSVMLYLCRERMTR